MARVNITVPDDLAATAKASGINISAVARAGIEQELDRRVKREAYLRYLDDLQAEVGDDDVTEEEAEAWAQRVFGPVV